MRILLVDDDAKILEVLAEVLEDLGHTVTCRTDGEEVLVEALNEPYDLLVTDIRMPGMDGLELIESLHSHSRQLPAILVTGHDSDEVAARALEVSAASYLRKPIRVADMLVVVRSLEFGSQLETMGSD